MSLRQVLLQHFTVNADGTRSCKHCSDSQKPLSAGSDSTAWKTHLSSKHSALFNSIMAPFTAAVAASASSSMDIDSVCSPDRSRSVASSSTPAKKRKPDPSQLQLKTLFAATGSKRALASLSRLFVHSSIAHNVVDTAEFKEFLTDVGWTTAMPTRVSLKESILEQARELRDRLIDSMQNEVTPITIASDGWTNVRQEKITNIVPIVNGVAYYWTSIVNTVEKNTAEWLYSQFAPIFDKLINTHKLRIIAFVVDNEAVNGKLHRLLGADYPFLVHVPCAAHTLQLIVRSCLKSSTFSKTVQQLTDLIQFFDSKENRHELKKMSAAMNGGSTPLSILKPNDTRWSSTLIAIERLLRLRREIEACFDTARVPSIINKDEFFAQLTVLRDFLKPFQIATDVIQKDTATLFSVYDQFLSLLKHVQQVRAKWAAVKILTRWNEQINIDATLATALLSFCSIPSHFSAQLQVAQCCTDATQ